MGYSSFLILEEWSMRALSIPNPKVMVMSAMRCDDQDRQTVAVTCESPVISACMAGTWIQRKQAGHWLWHLCWLTVFSHLEVAWNLHIALSHLVSPAYLGCAFEP